MAIDPTKPTRWIIDPSKGTYNAGIQTHTFTTFDGVERVAYNGFKTLEDYLKEPENKGRKVVSQKEVDKLLADYENSHKTEPSQIKPSEYEYALEVLPPCRWEGSVFHVSERVTGDIVNWYFKKDKKCYTFTDSATLSREEIKAKIESV
jgi:hypothetical protein